MGMVNCGSVCMHAPSQRPRSAAPVGLYDFQVEKQTVKATIVKITISEITCTRLHCADIAISGLDPLLLYSRRFACFFA